MSDRSFPSPHVVLSLAALALSGMVSAAEPGQASRFGVGASVARLERPYAGADRTTVALPLVSYESRRFSISGPVIDLKLMPESNVSARLRLRYEPGMGYEAADAAVLEGMARRRGGLWWGGAAQWTTPLGELRGEWLGDLSASSHGQRGTLGLHYPTGLGDLTITPRVELVWLNGRYAEYYYGVRGDEAHVGRDAYSPGAVLQPRVGIRADYRLTFSDRVFVDVAATRLASAVADSPIVDGSRVATMFVGYLHLF